MTVVRWLHLKAVAGSAGAIPLPESSPGSGLVDDLATGGVYQHCVALHPGEGRRIHLLPRGWNPQAVQRDDVRARDQRVDAAAKFELIARKILCPQSGIEGRDLHPERARHRGTTPGKYDLGSFSLKEHQEICQAIDGGDSAAAETAMCRLTRHGHFQRIALLTRRQD
nr:FCD domain-containing protein [Salipiger pallidus]